LADTIMPLVLAAFRQRRSQIRLSIISRDHEEIPEILESGGADLGLSISAFQGRTPNTINLWESELVCVVPSGHSLAAHDAVTPEMLLQFPLITFNRNLPLGAAAEQAFQSAGLAREIAVEVSQTSTACA
jgi:DNA-binding transcriptional LysR family regulator